MSEPVIVLNRLTKSYGKYRGVENLTLSVERGEIFGFIGPNGAGKSTTIRTLMGLLKPTSGSASMFGMDCQTQAEKIAARVGYLPGECGYYENLKVRELLRYTAQLYGKSCDARARELCHRLELDMERRIAGLSLGNRKKVGIVSALLPSPDLLILDEPTSGLDPLIQQEFYQILQEERSRGATIFFSSHILSEVQRLCDRAAILKEGRLIGIQSIKELRESGYKKVSITAKSPISTGCFDFEGIADYSQSEDGRTVSFIFNGSISQVLEALNRIPVEDVFLEEPSLEEIFLHYYE